MHSNTRTWWHKTTSPRVVQLHLVISCKFKRESIWEENHKKLMRQWETTPYTKTTSRISGPDVTNNIDDVALLASPSRTTTGIENLPITIVSSGISSMKHFRSVSAMWKYRPETHDKYRTKITEMHGPFIFPACVERKTWWTSSSDTLRINTFRVAELLNKRKESQICPVVH